MNKRLYPNRQELYHTFYPWLLVSCLFLVMVRIPAKAGWYIGWAGLQRMPNKKRSLDRLLSFLPTGPTEHWLFRAGTGLAMAKGMGQLAFRAGRGMAAFLTAVPRLFVF